MTNREIRNDLARSLLGAGVTVGLVTDAIRQRVEPAVFSAKENALLHATFAQVGRLGEALVRCGEVIGRGRGDEV